MIPNWDKEECLGQSHLEEQMKGFPGGAVVKNLSANAGDMGSSPGLGRSHMPRSNKARVPQLPSPCTTTTEPACHNYWSLRA